MKRLEDEGFEFCLVGRKPGLGRVGGVKHLVVKEIFRREAEERRERGKVSFRNVSEERAIRTRPRTVRRSTEGRDGELRFLN